MILGLTLTIIFIVLCPVVVSIYAGHKSNKFNLPGDSNE